MYLSKYSIVRLYMLKSKNQPTNTDKNRQAKNDKKAFSSVKKEISKIYYNRSKRRSKKYVSTKKQTIYVGFCLHFRR